MRCPAATRMIAASSRACATPAIRCAWSNWPARIRSPTSSPAMRPARRGTASRRRRAADHRRIGIAGIRRAGRCAVRAQSRSGLIHHPTALETGFGADERAALMAIEKRLLPRLARIVATSEATAERLVGDFGVEPRSHQDRGARHRSVRRAASGPADRAATSCPSARWSRARGTMCCCARWRGCSISTGS